MIVKDQQDIKNVVKSLFTVLLSATPATNVLATWLNTYQNEEEHSRFENELESLQTQMMEFNQFKEDILKRFDDVLKKMPESQVRFPEMDVVCPVAQSVMLNGVDDSMKELYVNLFVNATTKENSKYVHPSFAGIINQLTIDEIKLLKSFENSPSRGWPIINIMDGCSTGKVTILTNFTTYGSDFLDEKNNICTYIDNLSRLNLVFIETGVELVDRSKYIPLENPQSFYELVKNHIHKRTQFTYEYYVLRLTNLGRMFKRACFNQVES